MRIQSKAIQLTDRQNFNVSSFPVFVASQPKVRSGNAIRAISGIRNEVGVNVTQQHYGRIKYLLQLRENQGANTL